MLSSILRILSIACSAVLLFSFVAFASDQAGSGSKKTVAKIANADASEQKAGDVQVNAPSPTAQTERMREKEHGSLREKLDDANDALVSPFKGVTASESIWGQRIVAALLGFLVFGVGIGFLARLAALRGI